MQVETKTMNGESGSVIELAGAVFGQPYNGDLVHQAVVAYQASGRQGTKAQKSRSEVRGGGRKPWRQKGTGNARVGSTRSPLWRKGGQTFAAEPRDFRQKINRKMHRQAMRVVFSQLLRDDALLLVDALQMKQPKTADFARMLAKWNVENALILLEGFDNNLFLSARNIPNVEVVDVLHVDVVSLIRYDIVIMSTAAIKLLEERLA